MWEEIKKHPYVTGGAVLAVILFFVIFGSGGGSGGGAVATSGSGSDVESGNQLQAAQLAASTQIAGQQTAFQALQEQIGGAISLATIQAHTADNANTLAAAIASQQINAEYGSRDLTTTLSAQTAQKQIDAQVQLANISSQTTIQQTNAVTNALIQQASINAQTSQAAIAASSKGLFSRIFG